MNWINVAVPACIAVLLAVVPAVVRGSNRMAILEERTARAQDDIEEETRRNDAQDQRIGGQDVMLARIESKVDLVLDSIKRDKQS